MAFHIDMRPKKLSEVVGNEGIKDSLKTVLSQSDRPNSILFTGPSGCGKTTLARIAATMIGCSPEDVQEYNSSNNRGIDTIREIAQNAMYAPMSGKYKVYILDEIHRMTKDAQNALLKTLEDGPSHAYFLLCTTDPEMLIKAIITRCMRFEVKSLANPNMAHLIKRTVEEIDAEPLPESVVNCIIKNAEGCPRQAMIMLQSVIDIEDEEKQLAAISAAVASTTESIDLCRLLIETRKNRWDDARFLLKGLMDDPEKMRYGILGYLNSVLMSDGCKDPSRIRSLIDCFRESYMYTGKAGLSADVFSACEI